MKNRNVISLIVVAAIATLVAAVVLTFASLGKSVQTASQASAIHVSTIALDYANKQFPSKTGAAQIAVSKQVTAADMRSFGFEDVSFSGSEPQMQVVLVKTDSDTEHYEMSKSPTILKVSYVVIVYDLDHQVISRVITFNSDEKVKKLLASASKQ